MQPKPENIWVLAPSEQLILECGGMYNCVDGNLYSDCLPKRSEDTVGISGPI